ncbi:FAD-dependent monooxygenase [Methylonatrum kenyense]|uniref:FAD-dependent monooxygenase n=1 Tax=Methylonatrum kenyense TaxID=455253 RepID=UPI0020BDE7AD|nr:FAD-dependent monooxygenase [Methylonatrum kenyense]MCK8516581.1 FAD-dependent monooxygenase [Methylonatrum kenyense]
MPDADLVIAGSGLVGLTLACALRHSGLRLLLVDPGHGPAGKSDPRSVALAPGSRHIFEALGVWPRLAGRMAPIRSIHVSERGGFGRVRLEAEEQGMAALGHVIMNRDLEAALWQRINDDPGSLSLLTGTQVQAPENDRDRIRMELLEQQTRRTVSARLLLAADGAGSPLRQAAGLGAEELDYCQVALVATVRASRPHQGQAFERFTPGGPLALLPLPDGRLSLVWSAPSARADTLAPLDDAAFLAELQQAFGYRLGRLLEVNDRGAWPLRLRRARRRRDGRLLLVGNAVCNLHPVAGQGLNLALRDVAGLAEALHEAAQAGQDPALSRELAAWLRAQHRVQQRVTAFTHGLVGLFSNEFPGLRLARNAGLLLLAGLPPLRRGFAGLGMGRHGGGGRLSRGLPLDGDGRD